MKSSLEGQSPKIHPTINPANSKVKSLQRQTAQSNLCRSKSHSSHSSDLKLRSYTKQTHPPPPRTPPRLRTTPATTSRPTLYHGLHRQNGPNRPPPPPQQRHQDPPPRVRRVPIAQQPMHQVLPDGPTNRLPPHRHGAILPQRVRSRPSGPPIRHPAQRRLHHDQDPLRGRQPRGHVQEVSGERDEDRRRGGVCGFVPDS